MMELGLSDEFAPGSSAVVEAMSSPIIWTHSTAQFASSTVHRSQIITHDTLARLKLRGSNKAPRQVSTERRLGPPLAPTSLTPIRNSDQLASTDVDDVQLGVGVVDIPPRDCLPTCPHHAHADLGGSTRAASSTVPLRRLGDVEHCRVHGHPGDVVVPHEHGDGGRETAVDCIAAEGSLKLQRVFRVPFHDPVVDGRQPAPLLLACSAGEEDQARTSTVTSRASGWD